VKELEQNFSEKEGYWYSQEKNLRSDGAKEINLYEGGKKGDGGRKSGQRDMYKCIGVIFRSTDYRCYEARD